MSIILFRFKRKKSVSCKFCIHGCAVHRHQLAWFLSYMQWLYKYLLLAECEVRTASYEPSFFLPFMGSITCHMDRANEANKMFTIWLC